MPSKRGMPPVLFSLLISGRGAGLLDGKRARIVVDDQDGPGLRALGQLARLDGKEPAVGVLADRVDAFKAVDGHFSHK